MTPAFLTLQRYGDQPAFDVAELAAELAHAWGEETRLRVLFDWSHVTTWRARTPSADVARIWSSMAPRVVRAALVHDHRWTRQAALLSAVIRVASGQVRSFHPRDHEKAISWLVEELQPFNGYP